MSRKNNARTKQEILNDLNRMIDENNENDIRGIRLVWTMYRMNVGKMSPYFPDETLANERHILAMWGEWLTLDEVRQYTDELVAIGWLIPSTYGYRVGDAA